MGGFNSCQQMKHSKLCSDLLKERTFERSRFSPDERFVSSTKHIIMGRFIQTTCIHPLQYNFIDTYLHNAVSGWSLID